MIKWILLILSQSAIAIATPWTEQEKFLLSARTTKAAFENGYVLPAIVEVHWGLTPTGQKGVVLVRKKDQNANCQNGGWRTEGFWAIFNSRAEVELTGSGVVECDGQ